MLCCCRFTGIRDVKLCGDDGKWVSEYEKELVPYDAGTDSGVTYRSEDLVTDPKDVITRISAMEIENVFYNPIE